jgi:hypothetical protein
VTDQAKPVEPGPLPLITDHEFDPGIHDDSGDDYCWRNVTPYGLGDCGQPRAAHKPAERPEPKCRYCTDDHYSHADAKGWHRHDCPSAGCGHQCEKVAEPSPEAAPQSAQESADELEIETYALVRSVESNVCRYRVAVPGTDYDEPNDRLTERFLAKLKARDAARTERVRRESEQKIRELEQQLSAKPTAAAGSLIYAECGHNATWTSALGNCMACAREKERARADKLEAQLAEANQRAEQAESFARETRKVVDAAKAAKAEGAQAERERIARDYRERARKFREIADKCGSWYPERQREQRELAASCDSVAADLERGILSDPAAPQKETPEPKG